MDLNKNIFKINYEQKCYTIMQLHTYIKRKLTLKLCSVSGLNIFLDFFFPAKFCLLKNNIKIEDQAKDEQNTIRNKNRY